MTPDGLLQWSDFGRGLTTLAGKLPALIRTALTVGLTRPTASLSLGSLIEKRADEQGAAPAIKSAEGTVTYGQLNARANRTAHWLRAQGVVSGDRVAVMMGNRAELLVCVVACAKLGAVASMLNTHQRRSALAHSLACAPPKVVLVGVEHLSPLLEALPAALADPRWLGKSTGGSHRPVVAWVAEAPGGSPVTAAQDACQQGFPLRSVLDERLAFQSTNPAAGVTFGDDLFYIFTSGTTGLPKASIMSHKRWIGAGYMFGSVLLELSPGDTIYCPLPLYHNQALTMAWSAAVHSGAAIAIRRTLSTSEFWSDCAGFDATAVAYIGEVARYLLAAPPSPKDRGHRVTSAVGVGMRPALWDAFQTRFGLDHIYEFYSASELNVGFFNLMSLDKTVGICPGKWALVAFDVAAGEPTRTPEGHLVALTSPGDVGLLLTEVSARFRFEGYTDAEATERKLIRGAFQEGDCWVNTGDLMRRIGFGHLQFVDRVGDTFRWKGENVATGEVEAAIGAVAGVVDATVYGVEVAGFSGRAGMAAVALESEVAPADLMSQLDEVLCRELPGYAVPVFFRIVDALAVTGTFKHQKTALREKGYKTDAMNGLGDDDGADVWVRWPGLGYVPLTAERNALLEQREVRL